MGNFNDDLANSCQGQSTNATIYRALEHFVSTPCTMAAVEGQMESQPRLQTAWTYPNAIGLIEDDWNLEAWTVTQTCT